MLLGLGDVWISAVYIGNIIAVLLCVIYGIINWNSTDKSKLED
ncbi:symporter small accessory protein [Lentisphaerota bacterium WC36G]